MNLFILCLNDDDLIDSRLLCFSIIIIMTNLYYALYYDDVVVHFDSYYYSRITIANEQDFH